jgi:hypothetical protein
MKKINIYHLVLFLILLLSSVINLKSQTIEQYGSIVGSVIDSVSQEKLPNTIIELVNNYDSSKILSDTDSVGYFKIAKIPIGQYSITFSFIGFSSKTIKNINIKNEEIKLDVLLEYGYYQEYRKQAKEASKNGMFVLWTAGMVKISSPIPDSIVSVIYRKYGFRYGNIGCDPTGIEAHNEIIEEYLDKRNGKDWKNRMYKELNEIAKKYQ